MVALKSSRSSPTRRRHRCSSSRSVVVVGVRVDIGTGPLILGEAVLTQPVSTPHTVPASSQLGLAANAHVAALVASNAGSGVGRIELVASVLGVVVVAVLLTAGSTAGVHVGATVVRLSHCESNPH
jgi:hypothetical protein